MKKRFWIAARSTYEGQFRKNMESIRELSEAAHDDLMDIPPEFWCKAFFSKFAKCDAIDNNLSETFNSWIMAARLCQSLIYWNIYEFW